MPQTINTNLISLNAQRNLATSQSSLATSMQRLSSGLRVNSAKDDAAGLAIADPHGFAGARYERRDPQCQRRRSRWPRRPKAAWATSPTCCSACANWRCRRPTAPTPQPTAISLNQEFTQLATEAKRTMAGTQFNGQSILASSASSTFQIGANTSGTLDQITVAGFDWSQQHRR